MRLRPQRQKSPARAGRAGRPILLGESAGGRGGERPHSTTPKKRRCNRLWPACKRLYLLRPPQLCTLSVRLSCAVPSIEAIVASGLAGLNAIFVVPRDCSGRDAAAKTEPDAPDAKGRLIGGQAVEGIGPQG